MSSSTQPFDDIFWASPFDEAQPSPSTSTDLGAGSEPSTAGETLGAVNLKRKAEEDAPTTRVQDIEPRAEPEAPAAGETLGAVNLKRKAEEDAPTTIKKAGVKKARLTVYVFGTGGNGEWGVNDQFALGRPQVAPAGFGKRQRTDSTSLEMQDPEKTEIEDQLAIKMLLESTPMLGAHFAVSVGSDHVVALSVDGFVSTWGNGDQRSLGHRVSERYPLNGTVPYTFRSQFGRRTVRSIFSGYHHSFAITDDGRVWAWGLNVFGQCGIEPSDSDYIKTPTVVDSLKHYAISQIAAGAHHSCAITTTGSLLVWGCNDKHELGMNLPGYDAIREPETPVPHQYSVSPVHIAPDLKFSHIACGLSHNIGIAVDGSAWTWGYADCYATGHGPTVEGDIEVPTRIRNTATKNVLMRWAGAGAHFSVIAGIPASNLPRRRTRDLSLTHVTITQLAEDLF